MWDARDANRLASLKTIESWLELYIAKNAKYPNPELLEVSDKYIKILSWSSLILKQWYIWVENSKKIDLNKPSKDPLDDIWYF